MCYLLLVPVLSVLCSAGFTEEEERHRLLQNVDLFVESPVEVRLISGGSFVGHFEKSLDEHAIVLSNRIEKTGVVEATFSWDEILGVHYEHDVDWVQIEDFYDLGEHGFVGDVLRKIFEKQYPFFCKMEKSEIQHYVLFVEALIASDSYGDALSVSKVLEPYAIGADTKQFIVHTQIKSYLHLGLLDEVHNLSRSCVEHAASPDETGLAWIGLASGFFSKGNYKRALRSAAHCLVFAPRKSEGIQSAAYKLAMLAAYELDAFSECTRFHEEYLASHCGRNDELLPNSLLQKWESIDWSSIRDLKTPNRSAEAFSIVGRVEPSQLPLCRIPLLPKDNP